ncbi:MAG: DMT family transporter [bacterium]|nr:DMT family transporter [bacterium]
MLGQNRIPKEYWFLISSGVLSGLIVFSGAIFKRWGFSLMEVSILPFVPAVIFLVPFLRGKRKEFSLGNLKILLVWSLVAAFTVMTQFGAVMAGASVAMTVLLLYTQPIWTIISSRIFFKKRILWMDIINCLVVVSGIILLIEPWKIKDPGSTLGIIIALFGGLALSGWITIGWYVAQKKIDPYAAKFAETIIESVIIFAVLNIVQLFIKQNHINRLSLHWPLGIWLFILIFTLLTQVVNHVLYLKGTRKVPAINAGIMMMLEPVSGTILAALFLGQVIGGNIVLGGGLIILGNYLVIRRGESIAS